MASLAVPLAAIHAAPAGDMPASASGAPGDDAGSRRWIYPEGGGIHVGRDAAQLCAEQGVQGSGVFRTCGGLIRYAVDGADAHGL